MNERDLRSLLLSQPVPDEHIAEERTWEVVQAAFASREPLGHRRRVPVKTLTLLAVAGAAAALALTPPGPAAWDWVRDRLGRDRAVPSGTATAAPAGLPAPGQLLATTPDGVWIVGTDGSRRLLGPYDGASWAPRGLFAAVWEPGTLVVLDPARADYVHWQLEGAGIADVSWSASGYRLAYRSGSALRVVVENGTGDRELVGVTAPVAPAWRPGGEEVLAYADPDGRVHVLNTDTGRALWVTARAPAAVGLAWTDDGERLAVLTERRLRAFAASRRLTAAVALPPGAAGTALAARPGSQDVAYAAYAPATGEGSVYVWEPELRRSRLVFAGAGRLEGLAWSPDGRYLLAGWPAADEWLFVPADGSADVVARAGVTEELGGSGFPRIEAWCCPEVAG